MLREDWLSTDEPSRFSREFKLEALRRMDARENVSVLARELGVSRKSIYQWRNRYRLGGGNALRRRGRMTKAEVSADEEKRVAAKPAKEARQTSLEELARAQRRIAGLERKIGQQQVELDFFSKPCGKSGDNACGAACLAGRHLRSHPSDDGVSVARRDRNRTHVPARWHQPIRLLSALAAIGAPSGRDWPSGRDSGVGPQASPLWLPTDRRSPAA